jgi:hypothetical protein
MASAVIRKNWALMLITSAQSSPAAVQQLNKLFDFHFDDGCLSFTDAVQQLNKLFDFHFDDGCLSFTEFGMHLDLNASGDIPRSNCHAGQEGIQFLRLNHDFIFTRLQTFDVNTTLESETFEDCEQATVLVNINING